MVEVDKCIRRPNFLAQFFPGDKFARLLEQNGKDLIGLPLQRNPKSILSQFSTAKVRLEQAEAKTSVERSPSGMRSNHPETGNLSLLFDHTSVHCPSAPKEEALPCMQVDPPQPVSGPVGFKSSG